MITQTNVSDTYRYAFSSGDDGYMYIDNVNISTDEVTRLQFSKNGALDLLTINDGDLNYIGHFISDADLPNVFTGTNLVTLNSPSQLTAPGFYYAEYMSNDVNANSGSNPMSDYSAGDFHMLLLAANANSTSGCRYGTLLVTSPRLTSSLWIGRIWDYQFTYWAKK